jgi:hypothetical protein
MTANWRLRPAMTKKATAGVSIDTAIDRIQSEYREMPGLRLTFDQMRRLWMLDRRTCRTLLKRLLDARFLKPTPDGQYVRCDFRRSTRRQRHQEV